MKPIVYIYENQFLELVTSGELNHSAAISFEWKGEDVYHVFLKHPSVAPAGYPSFAFIKVCTSKIEFNDSFSLFNAMSLEAEKNKGQDYASLIGIYLFLTESILEMKAYRMNQNGIEECELMYVPSKSELYSRSKGLLETEALASKRVAIIGLGSFGSTISVELAKSGVGNFDLIDFDRIELSNISRHVCGVNELGRLKTKAVRDAILVKNPYAEVATWEFDVSANRESLTEIIQGADLTLCLTDNNRSRFNVNEIACLNNKSVVFGRAITRAEGGDVFKLNGSSGACYSCLINDNGSMVFGGEDEMSSMRQAEMILPAYTTVRDKEAAIQVGLSSDISPICNMIVKLSLVELSKGIDSGISTLEDELTYNYYFWANRREKNYEAFHPFNNSKSHPTILKWFGANVPINPGCMLCQNKAAY